MEKLPALWHSVEGKNGGTLFWLIWPWLCWGPKSRSDYCEYLLCQSSVSFSTSFTRSDFVKSRCPAYLKLSFFFLRGSVYCKRWAHHFVVWPVIYITGSSISPANQLITLCKKPCPIHMSFPISPKLSFLDEGLHINGQAEQLTWQSNSRGIMNNLSLDLILSLILWDSLRIRFWYIFCMKQIFI